jgi:VacB/RNase II family 3'-5' exoribonuclease
MTDINALILQACEGDVQNLKGEALSSTCWAGTCWIRSDEEDHAEAVAFYEELAEAETGLEVFLQAVVIDPAVPSPKHLTIIKAAERPSDLVQLLMDGPRKIVVRVRHQPLNLGAKRNRLPKLARALGGLEIEVGPLGSCLDAKDLDSNAALHAFLAPFFDSLDGLTLASLHQHRADARKQTLRLLVDAPEVSPVALLRLARRIRNHSDLEVDLQHRIAPRRAQEAVYEAMGAMGGLSSFSSSWDERMGGVVVTVDADQSRREALDRFVKRQEAALGIKVAYHFDTQRSLMVDRIAEAFPERGILTWIKHAGEQLYAVEGMIPQEDAKVLEDWSDELEKTWGLQVVIEEPFLRAPDLRHMHRLGSDEETIALRFNRPRAFPEEVLEQTQALVEAFDPVAMCAADPSRRDIRDLVIASIDPARTEDLDDALSIEQPEPGIYEVGVHIADVCPFVPQGSPLDLEGQKRGFTTYLLEGEIPVLPKALANRICSLHGGEDSLAMSLFVRLDSDANVLGFRLERTLMHNHHRLNYSEAQRILDTPVDAPGAHVTAPRLHALNALAVKLRAARKASGSLDLNLEPDPETPSHQLIEEFMLLANECVARFLIENHPSQLCLYRTHPHVPDVNWGPLQQVAEHLRCPVRVRDQGTMQQALEALAGTPGFEVFRFHVGQLLEKATYHFEQLGHGALAKLHYAHFTSPIRRYSDLIVHRLIEDALYRSERGDSSSYTREQLIPIQDHINAMEIRVDAASYESHKLAELKRYDRPGMQLEGRIVGLMRGRLWINVDDTDLRISVPYREAKPRNDPMPVRVNDRDSGISFALGQTVQARGLGVDWMRKSIQARVVSAG